MIKNNFFRISLFIFLLTFYLFIRLQNLTSIPVFGDEAIYIRWAQIIQSEETLRFIPQTDGKQPFFMWINAFTLKLFSDPLVSGRLISVFSGMFLIITLFFTTAVILNYQDKENNLFKFIKISIDKYFYPSILSSLIYTLIPFSFFFDRLALADTLLSLFGLLTLLFSLLLAKYPRFDIALLLGFILGLAWLTKSPAIYFIALSLGTYIFINFQQPKTFYLPVVSIILSFIIYNILRLGPQFHMIAIRNRDYVWSISEILKHPFDPLKPHLFDIFSIYNSYISLPLLVFSIIGLLIYFKSPKSTPKQNKIIFIVACWWFLPLIANSAIAKVFTARYILFTLPPLIILLSLLLSKFIQKLNKNYLKFLIITATLIPNSIFIYRLSTKPFNQKLLPTEQGYLTDWTSGWGIKESADYLKQRSLSTNVIVGTEGNFGTLPDGLQIYTNKVPQLTVIGLGLGFTQTPTNLLDAKNHGDEVYLLINQSRLKINSSDLNQMQLIRSFAKPGNDQLLLYKI